jgi:hypothetical protein
MTGNRLFVCIFTMFFLGCGGEASGPEMAEVSGMVTLDGKPLAGAEIFFVSKGFEGYGRIKDDGRYSLVRGAPVGSCKVYITKDRAPEGPAAGGIDMSIPGMDEEQLKAMNQSRVGANVKPLLPPEYSDPKSSKLSFDVPSGGTTSADFKL